MCLISRLILEHKNVVTVVCNSFRDVEKHVVERGDNGIVKVYCILYPEATSIHAVHKNVPFSGSNFQGKLTKMVHQ